MTRGDTHTDPRRGADARRLAAPPPWADLIKSGHLPNAYTELRSSFIHEVGLEEAISLSIHAVHEIAGTTLTEPQVSRIDLYADFPDWRLTYGDYPGFVSHAKRHTDASNSDEFASAMSTLGGHVRIRP